MDKVKILAVNPGSTSTKIAVYENERSIFSLSTNIDASETEKYLDSFKDLCGIREQSIEKALTEAGTDPCSFDVVVGRGTGIGKVESGAYEINDALLEYIRCKPFPWHAGCFGAFIAKSFADRSGCKAYIYDAPSVDEMLDIARITGFKGVYRAGGGHVLNARACAIKYAKQVGKPLRSLNLIVAHLGGGCTFHAFKDGCIVDNCGDMEGTYSPERGGPLPTMQAVNLYADSGLTRREFMGVCRSKSGFSGLLGTKDMVEVLKRIEDGDKKAQMVFEGMCYRVAKSVGGLSAAPLKGDVDAVIITGGIAHSELAVRYISDHIGSMTNEIIVYPGEEEMEALAMGGLRVCLGEEAAHIYSKETAIHTFSL